MNALLWPHLPCRHNIPSFIFINGFPGRIVLPLVETESQEGLKKELSLVIGEGMLKTPLGFSHKWEREKVGKILLLPFLFLRIVLVNR